MADNRVIKTTLELSGEGAYKQKLKEISLAMRGVNSEEKVLNAQFAKEDKSLAALTARQGVYQDRLELLRKKLQAVSDEHANIVREEGENSESAKKLAIEYNNISAQVTKAEKSLAELEAAMAEGINAAQDAAEAQEEFAENVQKATDALDENVSGMKKQITVTEQQKNALKTLATQAEQAAGKMSTALTTVTVATVTASAKAYMDFGSEMSNVATIADTTAVSMKELSKQALQASNAAHIAATEIAQGAYSALSSGIDTANVMSYTTEAAKAAKAGQSDLNTVVNGSTSIMNAWKIASSEATSVFEKLLVAQDKGKTTLGEISSQIGQITGLAPQLNLSLDETLAAVAALTKNGVQTSSAITGLRAVLSNVIKPTAEAKKAAEALGLEFNAAAIQSKGLTGFLADVMEKTGGSTEILAQLFGSVEGLSQIMLLGGSAASDYADALSAMEKSTGKLDEAFRIVTDNSAARLQSSLNKLKNNAIEFGQTLSPYIDMASGSLERLSEQIAGMSATEQKALLQTALWTAAGLKAISMLSKMTTAVRALGAAAGPAGIAAVAIGAVTTTIIALNEAAKEADLSRTWDDFQEAANANVSGNMSAIINAEIDTSGAKASIETAISELRTALVGMDVLTEGERDSIIDVIEGDIKPIALAIQSAGIPPEEASKAGESITAAWESFKSAVGGIEGIEDVDKIAEQIGKDYDSIVAAMKGFGLTDTDAQYVADQLTTYTETVNTALGGVDIDLADLTKNIGDDKKMLVETLKGIGLSDAEVTNIVSVYNASIESLTGQLTNVYAAIGQKLTDGAADTPEVVSELKTGIADLFSDAESKLTGMGDKAEDYAAELQTLEAATVTWIESMAGKSTETVTAHLGELEAIQARVQEITAEIDAANGALMTRGQMSYNLTAAGATTDQGTIAEAVQHVYQTYKLDTQAIEAEAEAKMEEADKAFAEGVTTASQHLEAEEAITAWQQAENEKLLKSYREQMSELLQGIYEAYVVSSPEDAALIKGISEKLNMAETLQTALDQLQEGDVDTSGAVAAIQGVYAQIFGDKEAAQMPPGKAAEVAQQLYSEINDAIKQVSTEDRSFMDTLMEIFSSDASAPLEIDTTNMQDIFKAAMGDVGTAGVEGMTQGLEDTQGRAASAAEGMANSTVNAVQSALDMHSPSRVYYNIGVNMVQGMINGVSSRQFALIAQVRSMAAAAAAAARKALDINSPSGVFRDIGQYTAEGMIQGINDRADAVQQAMRSMATPSATVQQGQTNTAQQRQAPAGGNVSVSVNYSGAFTRREAQRFGTALANQINADITGKGG